MAKIKCMTVKNKFITTFLVNIAVESFTANERTYARRPESVLDGNTSHGLRTAVLLVISVVNDIVICLKVKGRIRVRTIEDRNATLA